MQDEASIVGALWLHLESEGMSRYRLKPVKIEPVKSDYIYSR